MGLEKPLGKYSFKQCHVRRCTERTCRGFQRLYKSLNMHPHINALHIFAYSDRIWYMKKIHKIIYIHHLPIAVYVNLIDIIYISDIPHEHYMAWVMFRLGGWQWYLDCNGCLKPWTPERRPCGFCFRSPWCFWVLVPTQTIGVTWQKNKANIKLKHIHIYSQGWSTFGNALSIQYAIGSTTQIFCTNVPPNQEPRIEYDWI